ncbi:MAG: 50S ribosomal protein L17 [Ignavibacteria bacterium]|nr:50S ribosomal protein L17 [Ignavibacteria bacterium]
MEHRKKGRKLKRTASHKKALLSNLSLALVKHKRIKTTLAKAKELRLYVEPLITKAKKANIEGQKNPAAYVHYAREIRKFLKEKDAINILLKEIGPKVLGRNGGYTRVLKSGFRIGDGGPEAIIELVDFAVSEKPKTGAKSPASKEEKVSEGKTASGKKTVKKTESKEPAAKKKTVKAKETAEEKEKAPKKAAPKKTVKADVKPKEKTVKKAPVKKKDK